jgi:hypothetical protein
MGERSHRAACLYAERPATLLSAGHINVGAPQGAPTLEKE